MPRLHARQMYAAVMTTEDMSEAAEERGSNETSRRGSLIKERRAMQLGKRG